MRLSVVHLHEFWKEAFYSLLVTPSPYYLSDFRQGRVVGFFYASDSGKEREESKGGGICNLVSQCYSVTFTVSVYEKLHSATSEGVGGVCFTIWMMDIPKNLKEIFQITVGSNVISSYVISIGGKQCYDLPTSECSKYICSYKGILYKYDQYSSMLLQLHHLLKTTHLRILQLFKNIIYPCIYLCTYTWT